MTTKIYLPVRLSLLDILVLHTQVSVGQGRDTCVSVCQEGDWSCDLGVSVRQEGDTLGSRDCRNPGGRDPFVISPRVVG